MDQSASTQPRLGLGTNVLYGVGSAAFGVHVVALGSLLMIFFNQVVGLPPTLVGLAIGISLAFDGIVDPLIGSWSDHTRSPWGRRHPFMYASALRLPLAVRLYCLGNPPHGWSTQSMFLYLLICLISVRLLLSLYEIPSAALGPELTADYDQRTSLMSFRFLFGALGGAAMGILAFSVFLRKDASHPLGLLNRAGYGQYGLVAALVMVASIMISFLGTHRFIKGLVYTPRPHQSWNQQFRELKLTLSNRSFVALMLSGIISSVATGLSTGLELYINNYFWELSPSDLAYFPMVALFAALLGVGL